MQYPSDAVFKEKQAGEEVDYTVNGNGQYVELPVVTTEEELATALAAGGTVTLGADIEVTGTITVPAGVTATLDLAGHTISQQKACDAHYTMINNKGTLTVTGNGKISFTDTGAGDPAYGWGSYTLSNHGTLVVENGTIENLSQQNVDGVKHMYCAIQQGSGAVSTTINGGTISTPTYRSVRINAGALIVNGGTFVGQIWLQPNQGNTTLEITGGSFAPAGVDGSSVFMTNVGQNYTVTSASISGGYFATKIGCSDATALAGCITGGTCSASAVANTNPALLNEAYTVVENDDGSYSIVSNKPALPTATTKEIENDKLTFAMNFVADEVTTEQLDYYGSWYADFELTVNKDITLNANGGADGYLGGQYDGHWDTWNGEWVYVPFENVTLKAGESLKIMEYAAELMGEPGLKYTYKEVYESVKDFDCGMFLEPAFIAANPDVEITLELRMYNNEDETESYTIGETYVFKFDYVAYNTVTETFYDRADDALLAAKAGETVILLKDTGADDGKNYFELIVQEDVVFDLNGYTVTAKYMSSYGDTVDYSEANTGAVAVDPGRLLIQTDNEQVTVKTAKGFQFFEVEFILDRFDATRNHYAFVPMIEAAGAELLAPGVAVTGVSIQVNVSWKTSDGHTRNQVFSYSDEYVNGFIASYDPEEDWYGKMFTLTLNDTTGITDLSFTAYVVSDTGVKYPA